MGPLSLTFSESGNEPQGSTYQKGQMLKIFIALLLESYQNKTYVTDICMQGCKHILTQSFNFSQTFVAANM